MENIGLVHDLTGKGFALVPADRHNLREIYSLQSDVSEMHLWSSQREVLSLIDFEEYFLRRLKTYYHVFLLICSGERKEPAGFIYSYDISTVDGTAYVTIYLKEEYRSHGLGAKAGVVFFHYLFTFFPFRKIYCDVFGYNQNSFHFLQTAGFEIEGELREHRFFGGQYYSLYKMTLYRDVFYQRHKKLLERMKK